MAFRLIHGVEFLVLIIFDAVNNIFKKFLSDTGFPKCQKVKIETLKQRRPKKYTTGQKRPDPPAKKIESNWVEWKTLNRSSFSGREFEHAMHMASAA